MKFKPLLLITSKMGGDYTARTNMVEKPWDYRWSSVHAYLSGKSDGLVSLEPLKSEVSDWKRFLLARMESDRVQVGHWVINCLLRRFQLELKPKKPGRKVDKNDN